jgi:hypothetical protein
VHGGDQGVNVLAADGPGRLAADGGVDVGAQYGPVGCDAGVRAQVLVQPVGWTETVATSTALWRADVQRRRFLVNAVFTSAALPASALRWLTSPPAGAPAASGARKVGRADIDAIRELTHSYRGMDNRLGGGKLRSSVVSYLDDHVSRLLTAGSYQEETGRQLAAAYGSARPRGP